MLTTQCYSSPLQWRIQGRPPPALFLDQTEARRAEKNFFGDRVPSLSQGPGDLAPPLLPPPPLYQKVWMLRDVKMFKYNIGIREKHLVIPINVSNIGANYK